MTARDGTEVRAPADTIAWAASVGWLLHDDEPGLADARRRAHDLVVDIADDRWVRGLTGPAPLAALLRVDRDLHELAMRLDRLIAGLLDATSDGLRR